MPRHSNENHTYTQPLEDTWSLFNEFINHSYRNDNKLKKKKAAINL